MSNIQFLKLLPFLSIIALAAWGTLGDSLIKLSGNSDKIGQIKFFLWGMSVYALSAFGWFYAMKHVNLSSLGFIYSISTALMLTLIGIFYFKEAFGTREVIGMVLSIVSLTLLAKFN